jgi:hypothetical protein
MEERMKLKERRKVENEGIQMKQSEEATNGIFSLFLFYITSPVFA